MVHPRPGPAKNPLLAGRPIAFLQRRRFICQMLHEYIGYYYNYADLAGGGVFVLEEPGRSFQTRSLTDGRLPRGAYATLAVDHRGKTFYFAFAEVRPVERQHKLGIDWTILPSADQVPPELNYYSAQRSTFHLFAVDVDSGDLRQLTFGCEDDFDPCPLPDGDVVFMSSRRGGFCRCDNPFEPIPTHTLHRLDPRTGADQDALLARDERVASVRVERRSHRLLPLGLRRPVGGPFSRSVGVQSGRHESARPVRQLHEGHQRVFPTAGDPRLEPYRVRRRSAPCQRGRLAGDPRPGAGRVGS